MVFSSVPVYLDPPNWHQLQQFHLPPVQQAGLISTISNPSNEIPSSQNPSHTTAADQAAGSIQPASMTDRARLSKIQQPELALKCPRCESTNTKFCYFNNYSLSQPRHFCKTCRRYWTRGGALRNVPVGGGCRRNNKKSKNTNSSSAKSCTETASSKHSAAGANGSRTTVPEIPALHHNLTAAQPQTPVTSHLSSLMATLQSFSSYGNMGLNLGGIYPLVDTGDAGTNLNQFPLLENNLLVNSGMTSRLSDQFYGVKMEENVFKKQLLGFMSDENNNSCGQFWGSSSNNNCWTDLSGLNTSSIGTATNLL